jgi:hypothetical protein
MMERKNGLMKDLKTIPLLNWLLITVNTYSRVCLLVYWSLFSNFIFTLIRLAWLDTVTGGLGSFYF